MFSIRNTDLVNRSKLKFQQIFNNKDNFAKGVQHFEVYLQYTHFLGANSFYNYCNGIYSTKETKIACFIIGLFFLAALRSIIIIIP